MDDGGESELLAVDMTDGSEVVGTSRVSTNHLSRKQYRPTTCSGLNQWQPNLAALKDVPLGSASVAVGRPGSIAEEALQAAKVAAIVVEIPRLIGAAGILDQRCSAVVRRRAALPELLLAMERVKRCSKLTSTLYCDGQNEPAGQQTRYGATVAPQLTSSSRQDEPLRRRAKPEGETAIAVC